MSGDPYFKDRCLLLHFDGAAASTTHRDMLGHAITTGGGAALSDTQSVFGGTALYLNGSNQSVSFTAGSEFAFGTDDFTIEGWVWIDPSSSGPREIINKFVTYPTDVDLIFEINSAGKLAFLAGDNLPINIAGDSALNTSQWYHVAVCRASGTTRLFVDGVTQTATHSGSANIPNDRAATYIGQNGFGSNWFKGYIDEFRVSRRAEYTEDFTPPSAPFPDFDVARLTIPQQAAIVRMINPYTLDGRMRPRIPGMAASFRAGLGTITGTITEDTPFARWALSVLDAVTGEKLSQSEATGSSYSIQAPKGRPVLVSCAPVIDGVWIASYRAAPGEIIVARSPGDTPYAYRCTVGGVTGAEEPEWGTTPGGTTADGSAVWTCLARLVQPRMQGPLLAA